MTKEEGSMKEKLEGVISFKLLPGKSIDEFCEQYFDNYNRDQYEAVVLRVYSGKEFIVTLYALDKVKQEGSNYDKNKLPVKKFKSFTLTFADMLPYLSEFNFTISPGNYPLEDIEIMNK